MPQATTPTRSFAETRAGLLHLARCGEGFPVLLLHQTPRSWDEYRDVLPLLGTRTRAIAMDTPGFGDSPMNGAPSIENWAEAVLALLDRLDIRQFPVADVVAPEVPGVASALAWWKLAADGGVGGGNHRIGWLRWSRVGSFNA